MDTVLHVLYYTYILVNGQCIHRENVQFADNKKEVTFALLDKKFTLTKLDEEFTKTTIDNIENRIWKYNCKDTNDRKWTFIYTKTNYGYELYFKIIDTGKELRISNQKMCNHEE